MTTTTTMFRSIAATALTAAALGLAACGDDGDPASASGGAGERESQNREVMLEYAQCMRDQGVDFPDPQIGGGGRVTQELSDVNPDELRAAEEECADIREKIKPPELSEEQQQEMKDAALAHARCMREHGIDFPDPQFGADGGVQIRIEEGRIDPNDAKFRAAQDACEDELPDREQILGEEQP